MPEVEEQAQVSLLAAPDPASTDWIPMWGNQGGALPADTVVAAATRIIANVLAVGDANNAWRVRGDGRMDWGPGGAAALDAALYRAAAGVLKTDGSFASMGYGTSLPSSPVDGQEHVLVDNVANPSYQWRFRYNAGSSSAYKWEFVGGSPKTVNMGNVNFALNSTSYVTVTSGPSITTPRNGDYLIEFGGYVYVSPSTSSGGGISLTGGGFVPADTFGCQYTLNAGSGQFAADQSSFRGVAPSMTAGTLQLAGKAASGTASLTYPWLSVQPVRVA